MNFQMTNALKRYVDRFTTKKYFTRKYGCFLADAIIVLVLFLLVWMFTHDLHFFIEWGQAFNYMAYFLVSTLHFIITHKKSWINQLNIYFDNLLLALFMFSRVDGLYPLWAITIMGVFSYQSVILSIGIVGQFFAVVAYQVFRDMTFVKKLDQASAVLPKWHRWFVWQIVSLLLMTIFYLTPVLFFRSMTNSGSSFFESVTVILTGLPSICYFCYWVLHPDYSRNKGLTIFQDSIISNNAKREFLAKIWTSLLALFFVYCQLASLYPYIDYFLNN